LMPNNLPGTAGQVLTSGGAGLPPTWTSAGAAGWVLGGNAGTTFGTNFIGTTDNVGLSFKTNNLQRMYINNLGQMVIDINNANPIASPVANAILDIVPSGAGIGNIVLRGSNANPNDPVDIEFRNWGGGTTLGAMAMSSTGQDMIFNVAGTTRMTLENAGAVNFSGNSIEFAGTSILNNTGTANIFAGGNNSTAGSNNAFFGTAAGRDNSAIDNTFIGRNAGLANTTGTLNVYVGSNAAANVGALTASGNTFVGYLTGAANTTGVRNVLIGREANVGAGGLQNAIAIGYQAVVNASNKIRLGDASITVIEGQVAFTAASDRRFKTDIKDIDKGLDFITKLRPVSYQMKNGDSRTNWGFIAQDIEALVGTENAVLTVGQDADRSLGLRYTDFVAPLVKSIQEQQAQIEELKMVIQVLEAKLKKYENDENVELAVIREQIKKLSDAVGMEANAEKKK